MWAGPFQMRSCSRRLRQRVWCRSLRRQWKVHNVRVPEEGVRKVREDDASEVSHERATRRRQSGLGLDGHEGNPLCCYGGARRWVQDQRTSGSRADRWLHHFGERSVLCKYGIPTPTCPESGLQQAARDSEREWWWSQQNQEVR